MSAYLSGPMTGLPEFNYPAFDALELRLSALGWDVVSPVRVCEGIDAAAPGGWRQCMVANIRALLDCDTVIMLPGWTHSKGANLEHQIATTLGLDVVSAAEMGWT